MISTRFSILDVIFPRLCFGCRSLGAYVCTSCKAKLEIVSDHLCPYCEKPSVFGLTHGVCARLYGLDGILSIYEYAEMFQHIIKAVKFRRIRGGISVLIDVIPKEVWEKLIIASDIFFQDAEILAVPLHRKRYLERGFNQSDDIAHACAIMLQKNITQCIVRNRYTQPQSQTTSAVERYLNTYKAFSLNPRIVLPRKMIIVDDVWTTGSTIREICHVLKYAGVERVYALTLARRAHTHITK